MELAFIIDAVRRYWWIVVVATVLGGALGFLAQQGGGSQYQSMAVLLLIPPSEDPVSVSGDSERYVANQLAVLNSSNLADAVVESLNNPQADPPPATEDPEGGDDSGGGTTTTIDTTTTTTEPVDTPEPPDVLYTPIEVADAISFVRIPDTDIVQVIAKNADPVRAQAIANAYLEQYFAEIEAQITGVQQPEIDRLNELLRTLQGDLRTVTDRIEAAMLPFLEASGGGTPPDPLSVVPEDAREADRIQTQVLQVTEELTNLQLRGPLQVASTPVQEGDLPTAPITATSKILIAAGIVFGGFAGLLAAVLLARLSPRLLGPRHAEEILGQPLVGTMPGTDVLAGGPVAALGSLPHDVLEFVDLVCVRAEASSQSGSGSLVVAVIGSERGAGTTTIAAAMANRFAAHGSEVLLVDADSRDRWLSRQLAPGKPGIPELVELAPSLPNLRDENDPDLKLCLRPTAIGNLRVLGAGDPDGSALRRQNVSTVVAIASRTADVVVFDAGALMEASGTVQLAHLADAVVLAIPDRQQAAALETVNRQLRGRRGALLAVWSEAARRGGASSHVSPSTDPAEPADPFEEAERQGLQNRPNGKAASREISGPRN